MTATAPVPDGTTPPAEAVEAVHRIDIEHRPASVSVERDSVTCACGHETTERLGLAAHRAEFVAAAVVAALRLPERDRETAAKALDEAADEWQRGDGFTVMTPKGIGIPAIDYAQRTLDWLRARASALRERREP